jgi:hypothetical protein
MKMGIKDAAELGAEAAEEAYEARKRAMESLGFNYMPELIGHEGVEQILGINGLYVGCEDAETARLIHRCINLAIDAQVAKESADAE